MQAPVKIFPKCPGCGREFTPSGTWFGVNQCRARFLVGFIREHPGMSSWEIAQATGMVYAEVSKGMAKARSYGLLAYTSEDREQGGGQRYRYEVTAEAGTILGRWEL